jgi:hypothetical protein
MASLMSFDVSHEEPDWTSPEQRDVVYNVIQALRACDPGDPIVFVHALAVRVIEEEGIPTRKGWILEMKCYATPGVWFSRRSASCHSKVGLILSCAWRDGRRYDGLSKARDLWGRTRVLQEHAEPLPGGAELFQGYVAHVHTAPGGHAAPRG